MRLLLVEGKDDLRVIPWLVERAGIDWGPKASPIVRISDYDGVENLLAEGEIETQLKASGLTALGVMVDADESALGRWEAIRSRVAEIYPDLPLDLPAEGLVHHHAGKASFGVWIMPDNLNRGMLETFLLYMRPEQNERLLDLSRTTVEGAREAGAPFSAEHMDKAQIHTWLAWQDPPGRQLHNAIMENMLTNPTPQLHAFIAWFRSLYSI